MRVTLIILSVQCHLTTHRLWITHSLRFIGVAVKLFLRVAFSRRVMKDRSWRLEHVAGENNVADILTKIWNEEASSSTAPNW